MITFRGGPGRVPQEYRGWRRLPRLLLGAVRVVFQAAPREFTVNTVLQVVQGAATGLQLLVVRSLLSALITGTPHGSYVQAVWPLALLVALISVVGVIGTYTSVQQQLITELVQRHASRPVTDVATAIGLRDFDTPDFHDRMQRAQQTASVRPLYVTQAVLTLGRGVLSLAGVVIALLVLSPLLLAISLLGLVPLWFATARISRIVYDFILEMTPNDRKRGYVLGLLTGRGMAKEMRAFGLAGYLRGLYDRLSEERVIRLRRHLRERTWLAFGGAAGSAVAAGLTFGLLIWLIISGHIGLAAAGAAALAIVQLGQQFQAIAFAGGQLYESALLIEDLQAFADLLPKIRAARPTAPAPRGFDRITLEGVHFTYPTRPPAAPAPASGSCGPVGFPLAAAPIQLAGASGADEAIGAERHHALRGVSVEIERGEVIALVGENGSGKTTLAKVICGLYPPDAGSVRWDGIDISTVDADQLRDQVTVIFQDYVQYWLSAHENIGIGRVERLGDRDAVRTAARLAGADRFIEGWPESYDALLGPIFDGGRDLSIGQWQRLALARAFFRDAPLIILDEPTASLDARGEAELFARMRSLFRGRTVLLISHRFSSVRSADRIYVMKEGEVVEHGSHQELLRHQGLYAELFRLQAAAYLDS